MVRGAGKTEDGLVRYNEEENIEQVIKSWYPLIEEEDRADTSRLVVADSGSSDRTHEILMELQKKRVS